MVQFYAWFIFYFPLFWGMVMYDKEQFNKFQAKDKIEPQQSQLEPPDINWAITSHIKDKGISAITLLACSIPNKKTRTSVYNLFNLSIYGPG